MPLELHLLQCRIGGKDGRPASDECFGQFGRSNIIQAPDDQQNA